ncbi:MAG: peptidase rane alanine aminopeptidase [Acidimicrobiales bacterium]|nr:peptidase rane alanine aminopeptidase [Acidimicrobiales bacterium]
MPVTPALHRAAAALLALATLGSGIGACTTKGSTDVPPSTTGRPGSASTSTTATEADGTTTTTRTVDGGGPHPDPKVDDVTDPLFSELGDLGDPRIDVSHYDVRVAADPGKPEISGTATLTLAALTADPLTSFTLDLVGLEVSSLSVAGAPAKVSAAPRELTVTPARALEPGMEVDVVVTYAGAPETTEFPSNSARVGWQADDDGGWFTMSQPIGTSTWVPVSDHPSDKATWTITLDTPKAVTGIANGRLTSSDVVGDRRRWVWTTDRPMASYVVLAAVGSYDLVQRKGPGGTAVVLAFSTELPASFRTGVGQFDDILRFYSETFGPYPDDDAGAVLVNTSLGVALECQTRPLFGSDALEDGEVWALAHELAHQWYGDAVTPARWEDLWLSESFATYADWLYQAHRGANIDALAGADARSFHVSVTDLRSAELFDEVIYDGGARALHALRRTIGDRSFFAVLRRWFAEHEGANATTEEFETLASEVAGRDLSAFFTRWLTSPDQPELPR